MTAFVTEGTFIEQMTLNEITTDLLNTIRVRSSNDEPISKRQLAFTVKHWRALLLRQAYTERQIIDHQHEQDLGCVEIEKVDPSCCGLESSCKVKRTKLVLPATIRLPGNYGFSFVGKVDKTTSIPVVDVETIQYLPHAKYGRSLSRGFMIGNYMYFIGLDTEEVVNIRGIFEDPEAVKFFNDCDGTTCYDDNTPFPLAGDLLQKIQTGILRGTLRIMGSIDTDNENDRVQEKTHS